jgi:hypothetical protein
MATVRLVCWLDIKQERKCGPVLTRIAERAGWADIVWDRPRRDPDRELFRVEGTAHIAPQQPAEAVYALLTSLNTITNHCTVSGPHHDAGGAWEFTAYADGRQIDLQSVRSLTAEVSRAG